MPSQFVTDALRIIKNDPIDRLTPATRRMVEDPRCIYDVHCHIFDRFCISIAYFILRMGKEILGLPAAFQAFNREMGAEQDNPFIKLMSKVGTSEAVYKALATRRGRNDTDREWRKLEKRLTAISRLHPRLLNVAPGGATDIALGGIADAISVLLQGDMSHIYDLYRRAHCVASLPEYSDRPFVTVVLAMDLEQGWGQKTRKPYYQQVEELNELAKRKPILPFLALDPRRATAPGKGNLNKLFERAFCMPDSKFFGVKFYPALGYAPSDRRFLEIFEICQAKKIPIVTHCGEEIISTFEKNIDVEQCTAQTPTGPTCSIVRVPGDTREKRAEYLNEPRWWAQVMKMFPGLRLDVGHFGGSQAWEALAGGGPSQRVTTIQTMMNTYPGVYADFSYNFILENLDQTFLRELNQSPLYQQRCMFGTDYWVVLPAGNIVSRQHEFLTNLAPHTDRLISTNPKAFLFG